MAVTDWLIAGAGSNDATVGSTDWTNPGNITADDATNAQVEVHTVSGAAENSVRLFVGGVPVGDDKSTETTVTNADQTIGSSTDLWGLTPTPAQINASDFGFGYSVDGNLGTSKYLLASDFGFSIPTGATIDGIEVFLNKTHFSASVRIDYVAIRVHYTVSGEEKFPGTASNDATVGTIDWVDDNSTGLSLVELISANDGNTTHPTGVRITGGVTDTSARLFIGGSPAGDSKHLGTTFSTGVRTYGGASDLWGLTPSVAQINASNFGFGISITGNGGTSKYLYVSNFGFSIPTGATIDGIEVDADVINTIGEPDFDYISIKVYYTASGTTTSTSTSTTSTSSSTSSSTSTSTTSTSSSSSTSTTSTSSSTSISTSSSTSTTSTSSSSSSSTSTTSTSSSTSSSSSTSTTSTSSSSSTSTTSTSSSTSTSTTSTSSSTSSSTSTTSTSSSTSTSTTSTSSSTSISTSTSTTSTSSSTSSSTSTTSTSTSSSTSSTTSSSTSQTTTSTSTTQTTSTSTSSTSSTSTTTTDFYPFQVEAL